MSNQIRFSHIAAGFMALALIAFFTTQASPAAAPVQSAIKISVIDTEKILLSSVTGKNALADLKKLQETAEKQILSKAQELKDLQAKIADGRLSLSEAQLNQLKKEYETKELALRRSQDEATRDLGKKRDEVLAAIDQKVMPLINQVGKELGYTLIFRKFESGLIYADEAVDITALIVQRLDARK